MKAKNSMKKNLLPLVAACVISNSFIAHAAEHPDQYEFQLEPIVVTATATPVESIMKTNASINDITREELHDNHSQSIQEILERIPGFNGFTAANGIGYEVSNYTTPAMRGTTKAIVLIDGVKQDFGGRFYSTASLRNVEDIERIEVLKGTASTLYGAEAVGGVVNIITRKKYEKPGGKLSISGGSYHTQNYQVDVYGSDSKTFWSMSVMNRKQLDFKDGNGRRRPQDADIMDVDLKYGINIDRNNNIIFKYVNHHQDQTYVEGMGGGVDAPGDGLFRYNTMTAIWNAKSDSDKWANTLAFYKSSMHSDRTVVGLTTTSAPYRRNWSENLKRETWSITNKYYNQLTKSNRLSAGFDIYSGTQTGLPSVYGSATSALGDFTIKEHSVYLQDEWDITDKLKFTAGGRYVDPNIAKSKLLPSFDLGYSFSDKAMVYVSRKDYMVNPAFQQITGYTTASLVVNKASDLKPQSGTTNEIGAKLKIGNSAYFDISYYDRRQKDTITYRNMGTDGSGRTIREYYNASSAMHTKGVEINLVKNFGRYFSATLGYAHLKADDDSTIVNFARDTVSLDLKYKRDKYNIGLTGLGRYDLVENSAFAAYNKGLPATTFWVWNLYGNYKVNKNVKVWAKINNLFDKFYSITNETDALFREPRYAGRPGRHFYLGVEYTF